MPRLEVLDKYLEQGSEVERAQLTALLNKVHTGNRAAVKDINKIARSQSGCASWEAVCATWLKAHGGELALNLRGADSIMLRMKREIEDPSPFVAEVLGQDGAEVDWSDPAFQPPAEGEGAPSVPGTAAIGDELPPVPAPLRGRALLVAAELALGDLLLDLAESDQTEGTSEPVALHANVRLGAYELFRTILYQMAETPAGKTEALLMLQGLVTAAMRGESPTVMVANVRERADADAQPLYVAFVGKPAYFEAMGFEINAPMGTINSVGGGADEAPATERFSLDDWSDDELRALLKVRVAARRVKPGKQEPPGDNPGPNPNPNADEGGGST